ncbi:AAA family ATPase [Tenacibaculum tangerinum]|uniref:AAA family ATPase n=1 Tax=Tenacibaculum tangerinum TaxID=3038772 RepID=A0ABY8L358_9FLAO|nr:AAA family ATPase [Tenacibaculum tangerinum]WGH74638.1 AAA family ATPase [Tenacibaculum tangerinum]
MLQKIGIENYKAFKTAQIPIKPITILLGANSVGKSSIIQLLLLLQQTGKESLKSYKSALKLYGGYVNLGDSINLIHNKDKKSDIKLEFELRSKKLKNIFGKALLESFVDNFESIPRYIPVTAFKDIRNKKINSVDDLKFFIDAFIKLLENQNAKDFIEEVKWLLDNRSFYRIGNINRKTKNDLINTYEFLNLLSKNSKIETFDISIKITHSDNNFYVSDLILKQKDIVLISIKNKEEFNITSDLIKIDDFVIKEIKEVFNPYNTIFSIFNFRRSEIIHSSLAQVLIEVLNYSLKELGEEFTESKINYVSPLRAHPKRYYMLDKDKINVTLDTLDGDAIADVLKDNSNIKKKVNNWLEKFKLQVNVEEFKEVIHHLKIKQNNLDLDITDVGFGISQLLPVIIQGFLSSNDSTTIIEQPEIHLHPKIQAELADLFIDIIKNNREKKLVIETHSEYLLKRLRRRISEGKISSNDVSICLFHPFSEDKPAYIENLEIEKKGFFEWPLEFYGGELLKDTTEFLKNQ